MNRFLAYLLALLMALLPTLSVACEAVSMADGYASEAEALHQVHVGAESAHDCCAEAADEEPGGLGLQDCPKSATCGVGLALTGAPAHVALSIVVGDTHDRSPDVFLSADKVPLLRPPIA